MPLWQYHCFVNVIKSIGLQTDELWLEGLKCTLILHKLASSGNNPSSCHCYGDEKTYQNDNHTIKMIGF